VDGYLTASALKNALKTNIYAACLHTGPQIPFEQGGHHAGGVWYAIGVRGLHMHHLMRPGIEWLSSVMPSSDPDVPPIRIERCDRQFSGTFTFTGPSVHVLVVHRDLSGCKPLTHPLGELNIQRSRRGQLEIQGCANVNDDDATMEEAMEEDSCHGIVEGTPEAVQQSVSAPPPKRCVLIFDLETSGLSPEEDRIIEIAVVEASAPGFRFQRLVCDASQNYLSKEVQRLTGITPDMLHRDGVCMEDVLAELQTFVNARTMDIGGSPDVVFVAHNCHNFDAIFLKVAFQKAEIELPSRYMFFDTLPLARSVLHLRTHKLAALCEHFRVKPGEHRALSDTLALREVFTRLRELVRDEDRMYKEYTVKSSLIVVGAVDPGVEVPLVEEDVVHNPLPACISTRARSSNFRVLNLESTWATLAAQQPGFPQVRMTPNSSKSLDEGVMEVMGTAIHVTSDPGRTQIYNSLRTMGPLWGSDFSELPLDRRLQKVKSIALNMNRDEFM
jgi:DNA polymerase-3 subunit epsilon